MIDIYHDWGGDLAVSPSGDLAVVTDAVAANQRVLRRLLTGSGDYIWNLDYGGGLGQLIGSPAQPASIEALIAAQLALEASVSIDPPPALQTTVTDTANGIVTTKIVYTMSGSSTPIVLEVPAS